MTDNALTTCLWFDTEAEQAATFYTGIFKDSRLGRVHRHTEAGPGPDGSVLLVEFELNGQKFSALNGGPQFTFNEAVSIVVPCADQAEVDYYWSHLSEGGQEVVCGWLKDKYGLSWQIVPTRFFEMIADPDRAESGQGDKGHVRHDQVRHRRPGEGLRRRLTGLTILLHRPLNPGVGDRVIRVVGSTRGASLPRRSWYYGIAGAALLIASGAIHLDLYLTGYRSIPTIGPLFLLQIIAAFVLAVAILVTRHWLAAAAGAGFAASTLGGYLLSLKVGLFGFTEVRTTAGIVAAIIDVAAFAVLATAVILALNLGRRALAATAAASVVGLALTGAFVATPKTQPVASGGQLLQARQIGGVDLLTNAKGLTLYWFAPDSPNKSVCYGSCAAYWPPVAGNASAGPGVTGTIGTIKRTDGTTQATYDGHPLYTYIGDSAPGQDGGNNINLNGGLWHDVPVAGG